MLPRLLARNRKYGSIALVCLVAANQRWSNGEAEEIMRNGKATDTPITAISQSAGPACAGGVHPDGTAIGRRMIGKPTRATWRIDCRRGPKRETERCA